MSDPIRDLAESAREMLRVHHASHSFRCECPVDRLHDAVAAYDAFAALMDTAGVRCVKCGNARLYGVIPDPPICGQCAKKDG